MVTIFIHKRIFLATLFLLMLLYVLSPTSHIKTKVYYYFNSDESIQCYHIKSKSLQDISEIEPPKGRSIFFHETSCHSHNQGKIVITPRQACAVESAARMNPNFTVFLLFASPGEVIFEETQSDRMIQTLLSYDNIYINHLDFENYTKGTPVENLYKDGHLENSDYAQSHASDVLRYLTMWKFGGIYLDLDVIVVKSLENLPPNYAGLESENNVAAGVLSFSPYGIGHYLAKICLNELRNNFDGHDWGANGPGVITRLLQSVCKLQDLNTAENCETFTVYPPKIFYAVPWRKWKWYFEEEHLQRVRNTSKDSYVMHVWNKHSVQAKLHVNSKAPYVSYAKEYCPKVFSECDQFF